MINKSSASATLALTGFIALAGCSMGGHGGEAQNKAVAPAETTMAAQAPVAAERPEVSPGLLKRVQTALRDNRLYAGRIDGVWGPKTQGAIRGYQQSHSLSDTGEIDSATLASLKIASASGTPAARTVTPVAATAAAPTSN
jgi:peptidoglycan hydrolase-like protein with peptidoglycan-binding domain